MVLILLAKVFWILVKIKKIYHIVQDLKSISFPLLEESLCI